MSVPVFPRTSGTCRTFYFFIRNFTQLVNRTRRAKNDFGKDGKNRQLIVIKDKYTKTISNKKFLLYDSGEKDVNMIIITGTEEKLVLLSKEDV